MKWHLHAICAAFWGMVVLLSVSGCVHLPTISANTAAPGTFFGCRESAKPAPAAKTATAKSKLPGHPVATAVAHIVRWCVVAGILCLIAAGALGYFGQIIPAVKVGIAGFALPIFAWWFDYHYGFVIAIALIAAALGFLWAWHKADPAEFSKIEAKAQNLVSGAVTRLENAASTFEKKI